MPTQRELRIKASNDKWLARDSKTISEKNHAQALKCAKAFNGKSPQLEIESEITWKRPTKY